MRRVNNKGFAISTLIYGLSIIGILLITIIMTEMAAIRSNTKQITKNIEQDLNSFSKTAIVFGISEDENAYPKSQKYIVPRGQSGWYKIELWGSKRGAYTSGIIKLEEGEVLYFYVGRGGKETDVRLKTGSYDSIDSYQTRIMAAAGGAVVGSTFGGALYGGWSNTKSVGGYIDSNGNLLPAGEGNPTNGSLIGYPMSYALSSVTQSGLKSPVSQGGGGDGYEPSNTALVGGSSFISGYLGSKAIIAGVMTDQPTYKYKEYSYNESTDTHEYIGSGTAYYFIDGVMIPNVNQGDGKAKIEKVADTNGKTLKRKNTKLNAVSKIRDCYENEVANKDWVVKVISNGIELQGTGIKNGNCYEYTLTGGAKDIDEIAIWHPSIIGQNIKNHTVIINNSNEMAIKNKGLNHIGALDTNIDLSTTETETGTRISAYQYDSLETLPNGKYYIMPVLSENKVITDPKDTTLSVKIDYLMGTLDQMWSVEKLSDGTSYKITNLSTFNALTLNGSNQVGDSIKTEKFNIQNPTYSQNKQSWKIVSVGDGTYFIETSQNDNRIIAQISQNYSEISYLKIVSNNTNTEKTARFKFIPLEYSSS